MRHYTDWVYTCVSFKAKCCTKKLPVAAFVTDPDERKQYEFRAKAARLGLSQPPAPRRFVPKSVLKFASDQVRAHEDLEFATPDHPLYRLLAKPNPFDTARQFWRQAVVYYNLCGGNYTWMARDDGGGVVALWNIPPQCVQPVCEGCDNIVDYYNVTPVGGGPPVRYETSEIIAVGDRHPLNRAGFQSPLAAGSKTVDQHEKLQMARYFSLVNGANVGAVIQMSGDGSKYPAEDLLKRFEAKWKAKFQGVQNFEMPTILPPGMALGRYDAGQELAFGQSADQTRDYVISMCYGLSKTALGFAEGVSWATHVSEMRRVFQDVIGPDVGMFVDAFTEQLAKEFDGDMRLFWELQPPQDDAQQLAVWTGSPGAAASVNEYRTNLLGLEPLDDPQYDHPMSPAGMIPGGGGDDMGGLLASLGSGNSGQGGPDVDPGGGEGKDVSPAATDSKSTGGHTDAPTNAPFAGNRPPADAGA